MGLSCAVRFTRHGSSFDRCRQRARQGVATPTLPRFRFALRGVSYKRSRTETRGGQGKDFKDLCLEDEHGAEAADQEGAGTARGAGGQAGKMQAGGRGVPAVVAIQPVKRLFSYVPYVLLTFPLMFRLTFRPYVPLQFYIRN